MPGTPASKFPPQSTSNILALPEIDERRLPGNRFVRRAALITLAVFAFMLAVSVIGVFVVELDVTIDATGTLEPLRVSPVRSPQAGIVIHVRVETGDTLRANDLVAILDTLELASSVAQLETQLHMQRLALRRAEATAPLERERLTHEVSEGEARLLRASALLRERLAEYSLGKDPDSVLRSYRPGTHVSLDVALADVRAAEAQNQVIGTRLRQLSVDALTIEQDRSETARFQAQLDAARERLSRAFVRAPNAGLVLTEKIEELAGSLVAEGDVLIELGDLDGWRAAVSVTERDVHRVRVGDRVSLEIPALIVVNRDRLWGRVESVAVEPAAAGQTRVIQSGMEARGYRVVVRIDEAMGPEWRSSFRRGYAVRAKVVTRTARAITLVRDYVRQRTGGVK